MIQKQVVGDMVDELEINLRNLRHELCSLILSKELTDNEVISCSQKLDMLILEYQQKIIFEHHFRNILSYLTNSN